MSDFYNLLSCKEDLLKVLSALTTDALLKVSKDLLRYGVITPDNMETLSSLDHPRLDSGTTVRYLLQLVYERIQLDSTLCNKFLEVVGSNREKDVAQVCRAITDQLASCTNGLEEAKPGDVTERVLLESDVGDFCDCLIEVSHKWEEIAVQLKLPRATIEECRNASSNNLRFYRALTEWVCGNHKEAKPPTLSHLKLALASPFVSECNVVKKLDHMGPLKVPYSEKQKVINQYSPVLQFQSVNTEVGDCKSTLLEVQLCSHDSVTYQWIKDEQPLSDGSAFSGTHSAILLIKNASPITQGQYYCHVSAGKEELTSSPVTVTVIYPPDKLALLKYYSTLNEVPGDSWLFVNPSTFIDLALIKTVKTKNLDCNFVKGEMASILEKRHKIDYSEAFCDYQRGALVLVEGRPGSGKTTLAHKITKDWAKGKIFQNVSKLFHVSLRKDYDKLELFSTFFSSKSELYINELEECLGEGACFVLEGYDEYSQKDRQESIINKLINKTYLPLAMVIITSRPVATAILRHKATSIVEILGFTREQFDEFIDSYPFHDFSKEKLDSIKSHLKASTDVMNMCYLPLNANILCFLYGHLKEEQFPKTETQVYGEFVRVIILKKLLITNTSVKLHSLKDLPEIQSQRFSQLCSVAFHMTVECQQVVKELSLPLRTSAVSSLLTLDRIVTQSGLEEVYSFLHLTLQEYLAAHHLANLDQQRQAEIIKLHSGKDHMLNTFKFYCGLVDFEIIIKQFREVVKNVDNILFMFHCAFQTQSDTICCKALEILGGEINLTYTILTPVDFSVLGYVISNASEKVKQVFIDPCLLYEDYNSASWLNVEHDTSKVMLYNFESTKATSNLTFWRNVSCARISYAIKSKDMIEKYSGWRRTLSLKILKELNLAMNCIKSMGIRHLSPCIAENPDYEMLIVSDNDIDLSGINTIANVLSYLVRLRHIDFSYNNVGLDGAAALVQSLKPCYFMEVVLLSHCKLTGCGIALISQMFHTLTKIVHLNLSSNGPISVQEALVLAEGLGFLKLLEKLYLSDNHIDCETVMALSLGIQCCHYLNTLDLSNNCIGSDGIAAINGSIQSKKIELADYSQNK